MPQASQPNKKYLEQSYIIISTGLPLTDGHISR